jgi:integrase
VKDFLERGMRGVAEGTAIMYRQKAGHIVRLLGEKDTAELCHDDVTAYIEQREDKEGAHPHTVEKELVTLRRVFKLAEKRQHRVANWRVFMPEHKTKYEPRDRWLTEKEYLALLGTVTPGHADWIRVAVYTGGRKGEIDRLMWPMVDLLAGVIHMPGTKTDKAKRDIPIEEPLGRVLSRRKGNRHRVGLVVDRWSHVDRDLGRACDRVGIPKVTCNDLRRTFASWLLQKGEEPMTVARLLGHASLNMIYRVYGQLERANLVKAIRRLPDPEAKSA